MSSTIEEYVHVTSHKINPIIVIKKYVDDFT